VKTDRIPFLQEKQENAKNPGIRRLQEREQLRLFPDRIHGSVFEQEKSGRYSV
jgi:hypothetical protein